MQYLLRSFRTLMFPAAMRVLHIKDLKDLRAFCGRGAIDMQDLKDLKRFFHVNDRGGQAPALRYARPSRFTVGRGPVLRHASVGEKALVCVRFSRRSSDRRGNPLACACGMRGPPRYGPGKGSPFHAPVRDQASPNYGHCGTRAIAGDRPPRYGIIVLIVKIV